MGMNHVTTGLGALLGSAFYNVVALITEAVGNICNRVIFNTYRVQTQRQEPASGQRRF